MEQQHRRSCSCSFFTSSSSSSLAIISINSNIYINIINTSYAITARTQSFEQAASPSQPHSPAIRGPQQLFSKNLNQNGSQDVIPRFRLQVRARFRFRPSLTRQGGSSRQKHNRIVKNPETSSEDTTWTKCLRGLFPQEGLHSRRQDVLGQWNREVRSS